jgi:epoxyqueuosine reductase
MSNTNKKTEPVPTSAAIRDIWPDISGNTVNGLGETEPRPPRPVFWRTDGSIAHEAVQYYFYGYDKDNERISAARKYRDETQAIGISEVAPQAVDKPAEEWTALVKQAASTFTQTKSEAGVSLVKSSLMLT